MHRGRRLTITYIAAAGISGAASLAIFSSYANTSGPSTQTSATQQVESGPSGSNQLDELGRQAAALRAQADAEQAKLAQTRAIKAAALVTAQRTAAAAARAHPSTHGSTGASGSSTSAGAGKRRPPTHGSTGASGSTGSRPGSGSKKPPTHGSTGASGSTPSGGGTGSGSGSGEHESDDHKPHGGHDD